jgi:cation:H+ antiporter
MLLLVLFVAGLLALYLGADWLVRGASSLARSVGVSPLVVGLTVVAFGTSAPELVVSVIAALQDRADVAVGNVIGSNIVNIALILGLCAVVHPLKVDARLLVREIPVMVISALLFWALALSGSIGRREGLVLIAGLVGYLLFMAGVARQEQQPAAADGSRPAAARRGRDALLILAGLVGLGAGAQLLVESATAMARSLGLSELVIGLTIIALGTSLPELATSLLAALRREADIAVGNIVGSNIFNILSIAGIAAVVQPLPVSAEVLRLDLPIMVAVTLIIVPFVGSRLRLERWEGALLVLGYLAFTVFVLMR